MIRPASRFNKGFTLSETMISVGLLSIVVVSLVASNLFGLRMMSVSHIKLGARGDARAAWGKLSEHVRSAKILRVGTGDATSFTESTLGQPQQGTAIELYPTTNLNSFVRYFWDPTTQELKRGINGSNSVSVVIGSVTNNVLFWAEDFRGNVLTNNHNNYVLHVKLELFQLQYPSAEFQSGNLFDYYKLETRITRRVLE